MGEFFVPKLFKTTGKYCLYIGHGSLFRSQPSRFRTHFEHCRQSCRHHFCSIVLSGKKNNTRLLWRKFNKKTSGITKNA